MTDSAKAAADPAPEIERFAVKKQPGVTVLNGDQQTPFTITNRHTGEVVSFGKKVAEREFAGVQMVLTCDEGNGVFWIMVIDVATGVMHQNGYMLEHAEGAFRIFIGGTEAEIRAELMQDPPPAS